MSDLKAFCAQFPTGRDTSLIWLGFTSFIILTLGILLPLAPEDYWWYVRVGQQISQTGHIPTVDTFSYTQHGQPMGYHSWLSALFFWGIHTLGGPTLTVLVRAVLITLFYLFIWQACRIASSGPRLASAVTLLAALASSNNWTMRPQTFSYPLFGLMLLLLWYQMVAKGKLLWLLPLIMLMWVNLHGAFVLGFLLVGAIFLGQPDLRKPLSLVLLGMLAATLVNPRFYEVWLYIVTLLTDPSSQQLGPEWQPPTSKGWQGSLFFAWLLLFAPLVGLSKNRLTGSHWLWFLIFGWMALSGLRYVIWFTAILAPLTAHLLPPVMGRYADSFVPRGIPLFNRAIVLMLLLFALLLLPGVREHWWPDAPPVLTANTPVEATAWLAEQPQLPGPLWSHISFSSYLIYALPSRPVWSDTRLELYPLDQSQRYLAISGAAPDWQTLLDDEGINLLMVDKIEQANLFTMLHRSETWQLQYEDPRVAIFSRQD